ncbi:MAG: alpha/beta hydrolase [Deltaproteobacteria bacterium]|nr:alpha/beta hydrolase [Deltaproteobacteria bacterium]
MRIETGVVYGRGGARELKFDVYQPPVDRAYRPAVLLIHGGGWYEGDRTMLQGYAVQLARRGFVAFACEYRLSGEAVWPAQLDDVTLAFRAIRPRAAELAIDPNRVAVLGNSAGGHLALMLAATLHGASFRPAAVVALYPPARLRGLSADGAVAALLGGRLEPGRLRDASPIEQVSPGFPPTLLLHGNADDVVPCEDSLDLYAQLRQVGSGAELHLFEGAGHGFDTEPDLGRQCLQLIALFLERKVVRRG